MKKKIVSILVCMLLCVTVSSVTGNENIIDNNKIDTYTSEPITSFSLLRGKMAYGQNYQSTNRDLVTFDLDAPDPWTVIAGSTAVDFLAGGCFVEDVWYACEYSLTNSNIWTIDETTGSMTLVGASGALLNCIAYDDSTDIIYAASSTSLYSIDKPTGAATLIGAMGNAGAVMIGIASDGLGNLYGEDLGDDNFYSIDTTTGAATIIGPLGINLAYAQDMAIDKDDGTCYITGYKGSTAGGGELMWVDLTTGHATHIGYFPIGSMGCPAEVGAFGIPYSLNEPPNTPSTPSGPTTGIVGTPYTYSSTTTDPEGDQVAYWFDWGDTTNSGWTSFVPSGDPGSATKQWTSPGTYQVTAKAKDTNGGESGFSTPLTVVISPGPILEIGTITGGLFKVSVPINNIGGDTATNVQWTIDLAGGAFIGGSTSNTEPSIAASGSATVQSGLIIGFGATTVTVTATCDEGSSDTRSQSGFVFLIFIKVNPGGGI